ncbi:MAG: HAMP domain-containing histidine kinase [Gudongella sp.]|nr:HAMP domain-containing histidine kinase [Gudongella sp.]
MKRTKSTGSGTIKNRIQSSLVLRLNVRMMGRLLAGFISINIVIVLISFFVVFWNAENGIDGMVHLKMDFPEEGELEFGKFKLTQEEENISGFEINQIFLEYLDRDDTGGTRELGIFQSDLEKNLTDRLEAIRYIAYIQIDGNDGFIYYPIGNDFMILLGLFLIILGFEVIILTTGFVKGSRMIKRTLRPLNELAEAARSLNVEVASMSSKSQDRYLKDLAGAISSIDANRLDQHISVDSSQEELKGLAAAINQMLNRINDSYQSQVQFVSDASHELRTPISVIQGYVNLLDRWGKNDEKTLQESIDAIKGETESMKELVEQLLFLARGDNETIQLHKETFDVCEVIHDIAREADMIDKSHDFQMDLKCEAFISADKQLIKQAIRILVDNSIKYTPEGESIILRVNGDENTIRITVQDSGIGIPPDSIPRIFDRFYRSDESRARKTGGSGLGLSIAQWIIERHGAHFEVLSRVDIGTRITIVMPRAE